MLQVVDYRYYCSKLKTWRATSSASSKLIHGGLRYLEHYEFRLVSEAWQNEVLLRLAPHIACAPLTSSASFTSSLMIRIGLFLYDHLGKRVSYQVVG